jgi:HlyD family secretion protein
VEVKLSPDVSGEITQLNVKEGDSVKEGQLLAKIKPDIYQAALDRSVAALNTAKANYLQAKAGLEQSQAQFDKAEKDYNRNKQLHDKNVIADADFETIESAYKGAQASLDGAKMYMDAAQYNVQSAQASVTEAQQDLLKTTIYAPMGGIITALNIEKGERVLGTTQMEGTDMLHISNLNAIEARVDVSENDVLKVKVGDTSLLDLDAYPDHQFRGIVSEIAKSAKSQNQLTGTSDQVTNFVVKILVLKSSYKALMDSLMQKFPFLPGMSASVQIMTQTAYQVPAVPIQSVTTRATDTSSMKQASASTAKALPQAVVFIDDNGTAETKNVTTGIQDDQYIEIKTGLGGDEDIISGPFSAISRDLKNGDKIQKVDKQQLFKTASAK